MKLAGQGPDLSRAQDMCSRFCPDPLGIVSLRRGGVSPPAGSGEVIQKGVGETEPGPLSKGDGKPVPYDAIAPTNP